MKLDPADRHNRILLENVHPEDWKNLDPKPFYHIVVVGAGTAGLVTAAGAAALGAKVALIEKNLMGGDCLNTGCVPSKAFIRSSRAAAEIRHSKEYGIRVEDIVIDFARVMERVRKIRAEISFHDSVARFQAMGIDVFFGEAQFEKPGTVAVDGRHLRYKKAVIATGSRATVPPIEGLKDAGYLTNESVFSLTKAPASLAVIGAGPVGCELAQAFARLDITTHLFHNKEHILDREDPDAAAILQKRFQEEGIILHLNSTVKSVQKNADGKLIKYEDDQKTEHDVNVDEILVGAGREPNIESLNLQAVSVQADSRKGVIVDDFLRTTNKDVYAAGDVCMDWKFTHAAEAAARIVLQNALFPLRKRLSSLTMCWCTYTDPEIAHAGLYAEEAEKQGIPTETFMRTFDC